MSINAKKTHKTFYYRSDIVPLGDSCESTKYGDIDMDTGLVMLERFGFLPTTAALGKNKSSIQNHNIDRS
jgi:hypothetical protein